MLLPCACIAAESQATAQEPDASVGVRLEWAAPDDCPSAEAVREDIERLLGRPLGAVNDPPLNATAEIIEQSNGWQLRLKVTAGDSGVREREITGERCEDLAQATATIIALAIDPNLRTELPQSESDSQPAATKTAEPTAVDPRDTPAAEPPAEPPPPPQPTARPARPASPPAVETRAEWEVGIAALLDGFSLPSPAPGVRLNAGVERRPLRFEAFALHLFDRRTTVDGGGVGVFSLTAGGLRGCFVHHTSDFELGPCLSSELGVLRGRSEKVSSPDSGTALWWGIGAGAGASWRASSSWALELGAEAVLPLLGGHFVIRGVEGKVHEPPTATVRGFLGATYQFD